MNRGTFEGTVDEIKFVSLFNRNKNIFVNYLNNFKKYDNLHMVRVTTHQISSLSGQKVYTRADCYLASFSQDISDVLKQNNFYLDETILDEKVLPYIQVPYSGISIKMATSEKYQILKLRPNSLNKLFGCYELGAGASLFCMRDEELPKNEQLIKGWQTSVENMLIYFKQFANDDKLFYLKKNICENIKQFSINKMKEMICSSKDLQKKIFNGIGLYEEPYTAHYFYSKDIIKELNMIPFSITTGSGRSRGDYTIVLKPTGESI